jgi:hypothetical protein
MELWLHNESSVVHGRNEPSVSYNTQRPMAGSIRPPSFGLEASPDQLDPPQALMPDGPLKGVRPQWTPRTAAGRAKLMTESDNWEKAEPERQLQKNRDRQIAEQREERRQMTAALHDERICALHESKELHRRVVENVGRLAKKESEAYRRRHEFARKAWANQGRQLPRAQDNTERVRQQMMKIQSERAASVAARNAERRRAELEQQAEIQQYQHAARERAERDRQKRANRLRSSSMTQLHQRELNVDHMRDLQALREELREQSRREYVESNRGAREGIASALSPRNVRRFKAQEQARKADLAEQLKAERERDRGRLNHARRDEDERKRQLHNEVRRAALGGYGDRRRIAYSSYKHSGTSNYSQSREDGSHGFRHNLPSSRSPAGRWLREYAHAYVQSRSNNSSAVSI